MPRTALALAFVLLALGLAPASERTTLIVADLHLRQDVPDDDALAALLREFHGRADLILAGDVFELSREEDGAGAKLLRLLDVHSDTVAALAAFAEQGEVVFLPGDHDHALAFPGVAAKLRARMGDVGVEDSGRWRSADGRVVVEHGHALPGALAGEELEAWFRERRARFPLLESFAERVMGLKYALSAEENVPPELAKRLLSNLSWQQFRRDLELEVAAPEWDLGAVRDMGDAFLRDSFPEDDPLHGAWSTGAAELTDAELRRLCDYRAAVRRARRRMERGLTQLARVGPVVAECPRTESSRDPSFSYYWSSRDAAYQAYLAELDEAPQAFVHAHTHLPDRGFSPGPDLQTPRILNAGAFRPTITPSELEARRDEPNDGGAPELAAIGLAQALLQLRAHRALRERARSPAALLVSRRRRRVDDGATLRSGVGRTHR